MSLMQYALVPSFFLLCLSAGGVYVGEYTMPLRLVFSLSLSPQEWICEKCQARGLRPGERATSTAQNGVGKNASSGKETVGESRKKEASGTGGSMNPQGTNEEFVLFSP